MTPQEIATQFRRMADLVERNADHGFGGAFVVVPPEGGGNAFDQLFVTVKQDAAVFWNTLTSLAKLEVDAADRQTRQGHYR